MGQTLDTVNRHYNAVTNGGSGLEDLKDMAPALRRKVMIHQFEDGDEVCSVYELHLRTPGGDLAVPASEWVQVSDDRISRARL